MKRQKTLEDIQNELTAFGVEIVEELMQDQITAIGDLCVDPKIARMYRNVFTKLDQKVQEYL